MLELKLPEIGEGVVEGEIVQWLVKPGDSVDANDALLEVMTDKATIEVPSPVAGTITEHKAAEGEICAVGAVIAIIDESGAPAAASPAPAPAPAAAPAAAPATEPAPAAASGPGGNGKVLATPAARALAREHGIDLHAIPVDDRGRITKQDVLAAKTAPPPAAVPAPTAAAPTAAAPTPAAKPVARPTGPSAEPDYIPFRGMRRLIAEQMTRSYTSATHYTYVEQIDVTKLVGLRRDAKAAAAEQGVQLTYLPFIVKAICHALKKFPIVNAELDEANSRIVLHKYYSIGIATATEAGLMVPVIHHADRLSLLDIAREIARLSEAARVGKVAREDLTGGTFTITSLGQIGGVLATPIINYPEVGIIGVHAIRKTPVVGQNDEIVVGHLMNLSISLDHRVVDGYEGARFLQEVRRYLEDPNLLLLAGI
jgi:pyruvate dehydrogenase E2 component (dihydrolipoamide acetyltransferase)